MSGPLQLRGENQCGQDTLSAALCEWKPRGVSAAQWVKQAAVGQLGKVSRVRGTGVQLPENSLTEEKWERNSYF